MMEKGTRLGMRWLKAELHTHAGDDPHDCLPYSAEMLIDSAAQLNMDVLALTCHHKLVYTHRLAEYARLRGILLVPGVELLVEGCHVLVLNPQPDHLNARTFKELRALDGSGAAVVAPHPFYVVGHSLGSRVIRHADVFDAIEHCSMYTRLANPNLPAAWVARRYGLPMLGTSDTHGLPYRGRTFSWIEAEPIVEGVIEAIRAGRIRIESRPAPWSDVARVVWGFVMRPLYRTKGVVPEQTTEETTRAG